MAPLNVTENAWMLPRSNVTVLPDGLYVVTVFAAAAFGTHRIAVNDVNSNPITNRVMTDCLEIFLIIALSFPR
jgi:hypothetical protein